MKTLSAVQVDGASVSKTYVLASSTPLAYCLYHLMALYTGTCFLDASAPADSMNRLVVCRRGGCAP